MDLKQRYNLLYLASRMDSPIRCGGSGYNEVGELYYIVGGVRRSSAEFSAIKDKAQQRVQKECEKEMAEIAAQILAVEPNWVPSHTLGQT